MSKSPKKPSDTLKLTDSGRRVRVPKPRWCELTDTRKGPQVVPLTAAGDVDWLMLLGALNADRLDLLAALYDVDKRAVLKYALTELYSRTLMSMEAE